MIIRKTANLKGIISFAGHHIIWLTAWAIIVASIYYFTSFITFTIPWLPISLIGTAVSFYVGFKNNQAYDRLWEARKIWGGIVNSSRAWSTMTKNFITQSKENPITKNELYEHKERIIFRHIAWIYRLRSQLLIPTSWEHVSLRHSFGEFGKKRREKFGVGLFKDEITLVHLENYLPENEIPTLADFANTATQIIDKQSEDLAKLRALNLIDDFRQMEMQKVLGDFYNFQGAAERIKKFPLPRQFGNMSFVFICLFIFMLPFGMVSEFSKLGDWG
ncbi:MAG: bestrophin family ion channel, partial [Bacteroidota bacterium]